MVEEVLKKCVCVHEGAGVGGNYPDNEPLGGRTGWGVYRFVDLNIEDGPNL